MVQSYGGVRGASKLICRVGMGKIIRIFVTDFIDSLIFHNMDSQHISPSLIIVPSLPSTNAAMAAGASGYAHGDALMAREQTAGRGQRGNSWEAVPDMNITMSVMLRHDGLKACHQFVVSEAVAVAVAQILERYLGSGCGICVKWPNDIYAGDRKICGILIENVLSGAGIMRSVAGIGINVNQERFMSDAPNPVSMYNLSDRNFDIGEVASAVVERVKELYADYVAGGDYGSLHSLYCGMLWRSQGYHGYVEAASGARFEARISGVALTGHISLELPDGTVRTYAFKEISAIL